MFETKIQCFYNVADMYDYSDDTALNSIIYFHHLFTLYYKGLELFEKVNTAEHLFKQGFLCWEEWEKKGRIKREMMEERSLGTLKVGKKTWLLPH